MSRQADKAAAFRSLHDRPGAFLIPNPWDIGSARLLQHMGFEALATTSLGVANMLGKRRATKAEILQNVRDLCAACDLPVNADLEDGFGREPEAAAAIIREAAACGAVGGSIEDYSNDPSAPIFEFNLAVERVQAAAEAAHSLDFPFTFTARAEGLLRGPRDLDDIIRRLQAFEAAGADVLYAPALRTLDEMTSVTSALAKPVNVVMGFADPSLTLDQLAGAGVKRVSIGGAFSRLALQAVMDAARNMQAGQFQWLRGMSPLSEVQAAFEA